MRGYEANKIHVGFAVSKVATGTGFYLSTSVVPWQYLSSSTPSFIGFYLSTSVVPWQYLSNSTPSFIGLSTFLIMLFY
jgi:hypothetical protein